MELKAYWHIILRRWWIIVILVTVVFTASLALAPRPTTTYTAVLKFTVGIGTAPLTSTVPYYYAPYYDVLTSEYLTDDFAALVKSGLFAQDVSQCVGQNVSAGLIQGIANTSKEHRILTLALSGGDEKQVTAIAHCAVTVLREESAKYFAVLRVNGASFQLIEGPSITTTTAGVRERIDLPIRLILAAVAGIALAFLIDYLDDSVRGAHEVEQLGLTVLGEIPRAKRKLWRK
jgi:capsular polysaccharide biosynthesis protein